MMHWFHGRAFWSACRLLPACCATLLLAQVTDQERWAGKQFEEWQPKTGGRLRQHKQHLAPQGLLDVEAREETALLQSYLLKVTDRTAGNDRLGVAAPPFQFDAWLNSPLTIENLRGKVVLVRWWTDTCPYCAATSPTLRKLQREYGDKGLQIIAAFHPKPRPTETTDVERVRRAVEARSFTFPVAIDAQWRTLKTWWLTGPRRSATSATILVDKKGVIRFVHPGMEYHDSRGSAGHDQCQRDVDSVRRAVEQMLAE